MSLPQEVHTALEKLETTDRLRSLLRFEIKAAQVCNTAREVMKTGSYRQLLGQIVEDHGNQLLGLQAMVAARSGSLSEPGEPEPDALDNVLSALKRATSDETRIDVCLKREKDGVEAYDEALKEQHPSDVRILLERHHAAEVRHVGLLYSILQGKRQSLRVFLCRKVAFSL